MNSAYPYNVTLGPDKWTTHATFGEALAEFRQLAHMNHAHIVNWVAADVDFDGLTEEEMEAVEAARVEAKRELQPQIIDLFEALKESLEKARGTK